MSITKIIGVLVAVFGVIGFVQSLMWFSLIGENHISLVISLIAIGVGVYLYRQ